MADYIVQVTPSAAKQIRKLSAQLQERINRALLRLRANPRHSGCEKLEAATGYRIRVGDYRVIYTIQDNILVVLVLKIAHRRHVYDQ